MAIASNAIANIVREAKRDARVFAERDYVGRDTAKFLLGAREPIPDVHGFALDLGRLANWHIRIAYGEILEKGVSKIGVRNGFSLRLIASLFAERSVLSRTMMFPSFPVFRSNTAGLTPADFWDLLWGAWALFAAGFEADCGHAFEIPIVCQVREDFSSDLDEGYSNSEVYCFPFEVARFVKLGHWKPADVEKLEDLSQLRGIAEVWGDDRAFADMTERWCDWHFEYSEKHRVDLWPLANVAHDFLFPSWIFAIDRCRELSLGRSALGQHPLIEFGRKFIAAIRAENIPAPPVLLEARQKYESLFGTEPWDMVGFWKSFRERG